MTITHFDLQPWEKEFFENNLEMKQNFIHDSKIQNFLEEIKDVEILSVFIHTKVTQEIVDKLPNLKLVVTRSTGFDHIDTEYCKSQNITVCNVPAYGSNTVAEHAFALLLAISKQIPVLSERTKKFDFSFKDKLGFDLAGKTIGIIGTGKIGKNAIAIAKGFGMKVVAHDIYEDAEFAKENDFQYTGLDKLLGESDLLSLHMPKNEYTQKMMSLENIRKIKKGCVFINTSRGTLIDNKVLIQALDEGIFAYAGLDTMDGEEKMFAGEVSSDQKNLLSRTNVIYTPHSAFYTKEAMQRILQTTIENIEGFGAQPAL